MEWIKGNRGEALVEDDLLLAYVSNYDNGEEIENWKARIMADIVEYSPDIDFADCALHRGAPYNEKGKRQSLYMTSTDAKSAVNNFLKMTIKDILLLPINRVELKRKFPWQ
jgi:hypothetical protein